MIAISFFLAKVVEVEGNKRRKMITIKEIIEEIGEIELLSRIITPNHEDEIVM